MSRTDVVPEVLWQPTPERVERAAITDFSAFVSGRSGVELADYQALWDYSTQDLAGFWSASADYFGVRWHDVPTDVLPAAVMPGADWFPGGTLNYAEHALGARDGNPETDPAVIAITEDGTEITLTPAQLRSQVGAAQAGLRALGVGAGVLFTGLRGAFGDRSVHPDLAEGAAVG
jgi:acetoacetyl-CoA synthetase